MFEDALRYPANGDDVLTTIAIGGILGLLGFLILPVFVVYGYLVHVVRAVSRGDDGTPPTFEEWGELLVDGVKGFVIVLVYTVVPATLLALAVAPVFVISSVTVSSGAATGNGGGGLVTTVILLVILVVAGLSLVALLAAVYIVPAALTAFATTNRLGAAFSLTHLRRIGGSGQFLTGWLIAVVLSVLAGFVAGVAAATVLGILLVPFVNFYGNVAAAYALGAGSPESAPVGTVADSRTADAGQ